MRKFISRKDRIFNYFGIDRTILKGITIENIDTKVLLQAIEYFRGTKVVRIEYTKAETSIQIHNDYYIKSVHINYNGAVIKTSYSMQGFSSVYTVNTILQLQIEPTGYNLKPLTIEEYRQRVIEVFKDMEDIFGIKYNYTSAVFATIELNKTFTIDNDFNKYAAALNLLYSNIPAHRFNSNELKLAIWSSINSRENLKSWENIFVKSSRRILKTYDKAKQLLDTLGAIVNEKLLSLNHKVMRVEYTITDNNILQNHLNTTSVFDDRVTDTALRTLFNSFIDKDLLKPYYKWREQNTQELIDLINHCKAINQQWRLELIRYCRAYDNAHNIPLLFDVNDLRVALLATEKSKRTATVKLNKFKSLLAKEREFNKFNNTSLLKELINKLKV